MKSVNMDNFINNLKCVSFGNNNTFIQVTDTIIKSLKSGNFILKLDWHYFTVDPLNGVVKKIIIELNDGQLLTYNENDIVDFNQLADNLFTNNDLLIQYAFYGTKHTNVDVTTIINKKYLQTKIFKIDNELFVTDPCPGMVKILYVKFKNNIEKIFNENTYFEYCNNNEPLKNSKYYGQFLTYKQNTIKNVNYHTKTLTNAFINHFIINSVDTMILNNQTFGFIDNNYDNKPQYNITYQNNVHFEINALNYEFNILKDIEQYLSNNIHNVNYYCNNKYLCITQLFNNNMNTCNFDFSKPFIDNNTFMKFYLNDDIIITVPICYLINNNILDKLPQNIDEFILTKYNISNNLNSYNNSHCLSCDDFMLDEYTCNDYLSNIYSFKGIMLNDEEFVLFISDSKYNNNFEKHHFMKNIMKYVNKYQINLAHIEINEYQYSIMINNEMCSNLLTYDDIMLILKGYETNMKKIFVIGNINTNDILLTTYLNTLIKSKYLLLNNEILTENMMKNVDFYELITLNMASLYNFDISTENILDNKNIISSPLPDYKHSLDKITFEENSIITVAIIGDIINNNESQMFIRSLERYIQTENLNIRILYYGYAADKTNMSMLWNSINKLNELLISTKPNLILNINNNNCIYDYNLTLAMLTELPILYNENNYNTRLENYPNKHAYSLNDVEQIANSIQKYKQNYLYTIDNNFYFTDFWHDILIK